MRITDLPLAVLRLQYRLARTPLHLIERQVLSRLDAEARQRLFLERALGAVDAAAGSLLRDADLEAGGLDVVT